MTMTTGTVVEHHVDDDGHELGFVHVRHPGSRGLAVHFSAFFGGWGNARAYRATFGGYFHRLKMLGGCADHDWLFLCDPFGAHDNGSYYLGRAGDRFVERGTTAIIEQVMARGGHTPDDVVMLGSSMGATGALRFGLRHGVRGIAAVCPHIDLDTSAVHQDRMAEVAWVLPDGEVTAPHNHPTTREIARLVTNAPGPLPRLFLQSCRDDAGVHDEQVLPLLASWQSQGEAVLDERPVGGHTSDHATRPLLLDVVGRLLDEEPVDPARYQADPAFLGTPVRPPLHHRVRGHLGRLRRRWTR
jgi:pimeloyl-ACP methyl ester carboxylesterase